MRDDGSLRMCTAMLAAAWFLCWCTTAQALLARSGGFPKFPTTDDCGARAIPWNPNRQPRIVGGQEAPYGAVPWQVELRRGDVHQCGGTLLSTRLILTVAHCWTDGLVAAAGAHGPPGTGPEEQIVHVERAVQHPEFRKIGPYSHDIAILLLEAPGIRLGPFVRPACISSRSHPPGTWCEVSGWGARDPSEPDRLSPVLRTAVVPLLSLETCRRGGVYGGRQQPILDTMLCAGRLTGGVDACGGDSGGPLVCERDGRMELAGLVSWGDGCAKRDRPGVYTRISSYLDWIREAARILGVEYH